VLVFSTSRRLLYSQSVDTEMVDTLPVLLLVYGIIISVLVIAVLATYSLYLGAFN
jgi:hypothetical protein